MDNNETTYTLPEGWIWTTIDEIGIVSSGGTPDRGNYNYFKGNIPWVKSGELNKGIVYNTEEKISEEGLINSSAKMLPPQALLIALYGATVGKLAILGIPAATNQAVASIVSPVIDTRFLLYFFTRNREKLLSKRKGGAQPNISQRVIKEFPLPLPPLEEQHRIVSKIEELFSELDHAEEGLKKAQKQLEIYKQALLKSAFEGKLTEKWRENNSLTINWIEKSANKQHPKGWIWNNLGNIAHVSMGQSPPGDTYNTLGNGMPLINGPVEFNKSPFSKTKKEKWTTQPLKTCKEGDLLICVRGSTTGRQNIAGFDACIGRGVAAIQASENVLNNYLAYFTYFSERKIYEMGTGSTFPSISKEQISNILVPLCSINEQNQIIQELELRFTLIENLENSIVDGLFKIKIYCQLILKKAFEGKLVTQDNNDEPAKTLLMQIFQEKESYIFNQKLIIKEKPKKKDPMDTNKTIKEILEKSDLPIRSEKLWQESRHKGNIEEFYAELKKIEHNIEILFEGKQSSITLKR